MKKKSPYVCQNCGSFAQKWSGQCRECQCWNTLVAEELAPELYSPLEDKNLNFETLAPREEELSLPRLATGIEEFDRVCGGGLVAGSVSLMAGDPGIGKSTLLLQIASEFSKKIPVIYVSGEESSAQIRMRAQRLGLSDTPLHLMSTPHLNKVFPLLPSVVSPGVFKGLLVVDSIQTMAMEDVSGSAGTLSQIREAMNQLITLAKATGLAVIVVGHVTKEGMIAGPKLLEHMVDTVLYVEGDHHRAYRLLRTMKNRFGPVHEIGLFDMTEQGMQGVKNPSALFMSSKRNNVPGSCIFPGMEGTRSLLVEIQVLSTTCFTDHPRRSVVGWDMNRLYMMLGVLQARCSLSLAQKDVFLTVLGGFRIQEPCGDLAVVTALMSCLKNRVVPKNVMAFGEIGLTGEIYNAPFPEHRLRQGLQLGCTHVLCPPLSIALPETMVHIPINHVQDLDAWVNTQHRLFVPKKEDNR